MVFLRKYAGVFNHMKGRMEGNFGPINVFFAHIFRWDPKGHKSGFLSIFFDGISEGLNVNF